MKVHCIPSKLLQLLGKLRGQMRATGKCVASRLLSQLENHRIADCICGILDALLCLINIFYDMKMLLLVIIYDFFQFVLHYSITDVIFPDDNSREIFVSCDVGGKILLHKTSSANIPVRTTYNVAIACSATSNECTMATPLRAEGLYPEKINRSEDFAQRVHSKITMAPTSETGSDSEKFRYLAQRYSILNARKHKSIFSGTN